MATSFNTTTHSNAIRTVKYDGDKTEWSQFERDIQDLAAMNLVSTMFIDSLIIMPELG